MEDGFYTLLAFIVGVLITLAVVKLYFHRSMYGGELFVDRSCKRPDIYLDLDQKYSDANEIAKQRYILLRIKVIRSRSAD